MSLDGLDALIALANDEARFRDPIDWEETLPVRPSSPAWRAVIRGVYGTEMNDAESELFRELTGGIVARPGGYLEFLVIGGRRGGKSETIGRIAMFEAIFGGHERVLAKGQRGLIPVISPLREQSDEILGYVRGLASLPPIARKLAKAPTRYSVLLNTGIEIRVMTADAINVSGPTIVTVIRDEWAKWPGNESTMPDAEIEKSLRPALAPVRGAPPRRLIGITSAYIQAGLAHKTDTDCFGVPTATTLVFHGTTEVFNPNIDRDWLANERLKDPSAYAREYGCVWQPAIIEGYFPMEVVVRSVDTGRDARPQRGIQGVYYYAAIDQAFRNDLFALSIVSRQRRDDGKTITTVEGIWTWRGKGDGAPLNTEEKSAEIAGILKAFGCDRCSADQFAFDPLREAFARNGIVLQLKPWHASTKPAKFAKVRTGLTDGLIRFPDDPELVREFCNIRAKLTQSGGQQIDAGSGTDDRAHATVLAICDAMEAEPDLDERFADTPKLKPGSPEWHQAQEDARFRQLSEDFDRRSGDDDDNSWILGPGAR